MKTLPLSLAAFGFAALALTASPVKADSLETMERERALLVELLFDPNLDSESRERKIIENKRRLADMERRVLRDDSLKGKNTQAVRHAFENYDLTFLVHAASENNYTLQDQWMEQLGISTHSLMNAKMRRR